MADEKKDQITAKDEGDRVQQNPSGSTQPGLEDTNADLEPGKVVGDFAMQPDPNSDRPAPLPNVPKGVNPAPADDADDAGAIGAGEQDTSSQKSSRRK